MLYLLDANTLIDAKRDFYPIGKVPEFWDWLKYHGEQGTIKIPCEIYEEFSDTKNKDGVRDDLAEWAADPQVKDALLFDEEVDLDLVSRVTYGGYLPNPTDENLIRMGNDPFLIAHAFADIQNRCVVSGEGHRPSAQGANNLIHILPSALKGFPFGALAPYCSNPQELYFAPAFVLELRTRKLRRLKNL